MKILKKLLGLILAFIITFNPILSVWAARNDQQIVSDGGTTSGDKVGISKTIASSELVNYFDITLKVRTQEEAKEALRKNCGVLRRALNSFSEL